MFYAQGVKANVLFFDKKPASERPWTERLWVYDLRTNQHFTLKQNPLRREHLQEFVDCYAPGKPRSGRTESERFRCYAYDDLLAREKVNLDITWLRDASLEDFDNLPAPEVIAREIVEDLTAALAEFEAIAAAWRPSPLWLRIRGPRISLRRTCSVPPGQAVVAVERHQLRRLHERWPLDRRHLRRQAPSGS